MPVHVNDLSDDLLVEAYSQYTGDGDVSLPLSETERNSILFGFHFADILYLEKRDGKWVDVTPPGMEGEATVVKDDEGNLIPFVPPSIKPS